MIFSDYSLAFFIGRKKGVKGSSPLPWSVRYEVAIGIAEAVAKEIEVYGESGASPVVIGRWAPQECWRES